MVFSRKFTDFRLIREHVRNVSFAHNGESDDVRRLVALAAVLIRIVAIVTRERTRLLLLLLESGAIN